MAYIVDTINNTLIDDEKPFTKIADNLGKKKEYKQLEFDFSEKKKDVPVRKPGAVPPKTQTIKKFKDGSKPIVRKENLDERIQRMVYQYDGKPNDKPPLHYNNPNIIDEENYGKRPKPFNNNDPSSYPSDRDQRQRISSWDLILDTTIKSGTAREKKEMRKYLRDKYKDPNQRKYFSEKEKRFISAYKPPEVTIPKVDTTILTQNFKPIEQTIEDKIREQQFQKMLEDQRRAKAERQGGLAYLLGIDE
tara:strand:+ start:1195 stop:1938 length:744 start_codon:yes stop_codon:yes gene_type:complete